MGIKFKHLPDLTDEEEAKIQRQIASDPDAPEATDEQLAQAKPFKEALPDLYESIQRSRGRPRVDNPLEAVTIRLDHETLARFKASGKNWRTKMAEALRSAKV